MNAHPDHRDLGRAMNIFTSSPLVGSGLPLWLPGGAAMRYELECLAREIARRDGCQPVYSPVLGKRSLFERSGHWHKFADDMFPPLDDGSGDPLVLRPANCPHHAQLYASQPRSHRDLPVRYHELAAMFRAERSGVVTGMSRVRQINLDDTHVFARPDQVGEEVRRALSSVLEVFGLLGLDVDHVRLSGRDDSDRWLGDIRQWEDAERQLGSALEEVASPAGLSWRHAVGEAAFYGPKLDVQFVSPVGEEQTLATVQLDFNQPERFGLEYVTADGGRGRPVMIHRGTVGAMERIVAFLLEAHDGRVPFWLAPVQVCLLPVSAEEDVSRAVEAAHRELEAAGLRVHVEPDGSLGNRIRLARGRRDALEAVVGSAEARDGQVTVTDPVQGSRETLAVPEFVSRAAAAARDRGLRICLP
ncbi:MAG TPA: threonine--tRNA ligase [Nitriliruptorales bacterium]